ncbi:MAG: hypothetical protein VX344_06645 [Bacteroidota bacterium]|nr:hypothetical protein [Bacteroidota bacterium]
MKKIALIFVGLLIGFFSYSQESVVKVSGLDAAFGMYEVSYERTFNEGMNNIKSSGRLRSQGKWPNILTKGSLQFSLSFISLNQSQTFGDGLTAVIDTNSNYDFNNNVNGIQVVAESTNHSVARQSVTKVSGFGFGVEYRSYIKTYSQNIGDPPRGWYFAPFVNIQSTTIDFDDNTPLEVNQAMNYLMYPQLYQNDVFEGYTGPWLNSENTDPTADNYGEANTNGAIFTNPNSTNAAVSNYDLTWHDVSYKQNEFTFMGGVAIGRQWLFFDKLSLDIQVGPQYKLVSRSERVFNGNDTWNLNQNVDNVNDLAYDPNYYLQIKYGDVYAFSGTAPDTDVANGYYGIVDEDGNTVVIKAKGNESLKFTSGFYRDLDGLTDFAKLETYRIKIRLGFAF